MIAHQSSGTATPSTISWPVGVCIQLFAASIQKAEIMVPIATTIAANTCSQRGTRPQPNSMTPRKVASRKNAVSTS